MSTAGKGQGSVSSPQRKAKGGIAKPWNARKCKQRGYHANDPSGQWINGLVVLRSGEVSDASFQYHSTVSDREWRYLKVNTAYKEDLRRSAGCYTGADVSSHQVFGDDKFTVEAWCAAPDGSAIALMVASGFEDNYPKNGDINPYIDKRPHHPTKWIDSTGAEWTYYPTRGHYSNRATGHTGYKYIFIPAVDRFQAKQIRRDLM